MTHILYNTLTFVFIVISVLSNAQESFFLSSSGSFVKSEEQAIIRLQIEQPDSFTLELYSAKWENNNWKGHNFEQKAIWLSDSILQLSNNKKMRSSFTRIVVSEIGDTRLIKQINTDGRLEFMSEVLNVFPLERHGKTIVYDLQGLPMLEEYYLLGKKTKQSLLFNPVDSGVVITKTPEFPGGRNEFLKAIAREILYPIHDMNNGNGGNTFVKFKIDENGKICDAQSAIFPDNSLNKELLRVIKRMKEVWQPAEANGRKIPVWYYATVTFQSMLFSFR